MAAKHPLRLEPSTNHDKFAIVHDHTLGGALLHTWPPDGGCRYHGSWHTTHTPSDTVFETDVPTIRL